MSQNEPANEDCFKREARQAIESWRPELEKTGGTLTVRQAAGLLLTYRADDPMLELGDIEGEIFDMEARLCNHLKESVLNRGDAYKEWRLPIGEVAHWARKNKIGYYELINDLLGPFPEDLPEALSMHLTWKELQHSLIPSVAFLIKVHHKFWVKDFDPDDWASKTTVIDYAREHGAPYGIDSENKAKAVDTLTRPAEYSRGGNRKLKT